MQFDTDNYPYPSQRQVVFGTKGMVATSQPQAAQAGLDILRRGGNAVDAAVAAAACLTVTEPTSNGIGSDAFAIVWHQGVPYGLNCSGRSPAAASIDTIRSFGYEQMPIFGWLPVTVPGAPGAWAELSRRFGRFSLAEVLQPAADYAREGFPVAPVTARYWAKAARRYQAELPEEQYRQWCKVFAPAGRAPRAGETWSSPDHAASIESIGESDARSFYQGSLAQQIDEASRASGGLLRGEDLQNFKPEWVEPVSVTYRGYEVWELPPNTQGIIALMALNILKVYDLDACSELERYHLQIEAMKLAFADGLEYITQPDLMDISVDALLSGAYAEQRRAGITSRAADPKPGNPQAGGTVYLATADRWGTMVSYIQSNYMGFGSGIVIPSTGISLQNRGHTFSLDPAHVNCLEPGKKTFHTIIPGFLTKNREPIGPFGVMGGFMQPQGHLQVISGMLDGNLNPQSALDAPRWQWVEGRKILLEPSVPAEIQQQLIQRGHQIQVEPDAGAFGRGQIIWRDPETGVLCGGTEPRTDGMVAVW